jgi:regulation of enolase protein 1 (concanavalin A-like superfamily)
MSWKKSEQPIKITRVSKTDFEIHCDYKFWADIADSLFRDLCQFPAEYENKLIDPTVESLPSQRSKS